MMTTEQLAALRRTAFNLGDAAALKQCDIKAERRKAYRRRPSPSRNFGSDSTSLSPRSCLVAPPREVLSKKNPPSYVDWGRQKLGEQYGADVAAKAVYMNTIYNGEQRARMVLFEIGYGAQQIAPAVPVPREYVAPNPPAGETVLVTVPRYMIAGLSEDQIRQGSVNALKKERPNDYQKAELVRVTEDATKSKYVISYVIPWPKPAERATPGKRMIRLPKGA